MKSTPHQSASSLARQAADRESIQEDREFQTRNRELARQPTLDALRGKLGLRKLEGAPVPSLFANVDYQVRTNGVSLPIVRLR